MNILRRIQEKNVKRKIKTLAPFLLTQKGTLLDFGCGDLSLSKAISKLNPNLKITGIDVIDFGIRYKGIKFVHYHGQELPYKNNTFDTVLAFHVLHHCSDAQTAFKECARVAKKKLIIVEPIYRSVMEINFMRILDYLLNVWKGKIIPFSYQFHSLKDWKNFIQENNLIPIFKKDIEIFPRWLPTGRSYLFVIDKK